MGFGLQVNKTLCEALCIAFFLPLFQSLLLNFIAVLLLCMLYMILSAFAACL